MQAIKDNFVKKVAQAAGNSVGASIVLQLGVTSHQQYSNQFPAATVHLGAGPPGVPGVRSVKYAPTHQQVQAFLSNKRDIVYELFLTEIVQYWFDFMVEIYREAIRGNASGKYSYRIPITKTRVNLSLTGLLLLQDLEESACSDFDFLPAAEKLKIVAAVLRADLSSVANDVTVQKVNIQVRNILQHRNGIVSPKDLLDLGIASIQEDQGNSIRYVTAGNRVTRTGFDIENLVDSLTNIANILVP